jgi:hypothetical protein
MRRTLACLVALTLVLGLAAASGCATASTPEPSSVVAGTPSSETTSTEASVEATAFDAQAIADLPSGQFAAAIQGLTTEQTDQVRAIITARLAAEKAAAPKKYAHLSARSFKLLVKNPDSYADKTYYIYGEITQFDAATGTDTFRADVGPKKLKTSYGYVFYPQNAMLTGDESSLSKFVENDLFIAKVTVVGAYSYDTQIGGSTTVPSFHVDSISRYGTSK